MAKLHLWRQGKRSNCWLVPAVVVLDDVMLAIVLAIADATVNLRVVEG